MSKRSVVIILIISLAFNLAFVGTFLLHRVIMPPRFNDPEMGRPRLPVHCRDDFHKLREKMGEKHQEYFQTRREFILSLLEEDPDEQQILNKLDAAIKKQAQVEKEIGLSFIKLRKKMTSEEAKKFFCNDLRQPERDDGMMRRRKK